MHRSMGLRTVNLIVILKMSWSKKSLDSRKPANKLGARKARSSVIGMKRKRPCEKTVRSSQRSYKESLNTYGGEGKVKQSFRDCKLMW